MKQYFGFSGITRPHFRGADSVPSTVVNRAMIGGPEVPVKIS